MLVENLDYSKSAANLMLFPEITKKINTLLVPVPARWQKQGRLVTNCCGAAIAKNQRAIFLLLRLPCTIFALQKTGS